MGGKKRTPWQAMLFGRASERALGAYFLQERLVPMALVIEGFKLPKLQKSCLFRSA